MANSQIGVGGGVAGRVTFHSDITPSIVVGGTAGSETLPSITIPAGYIPAGAVVRQVFAAFSYRKAVESSSSDNAVDGGQSIQIRNDTPSTFRTVINIADNSLAHAADETSGGFLQVGDNEISALDAWNGADTYNFQWANAEVDGDSITFHDVQTHLIIDFS